LKIRGYRIEEILAQRDDLIIARALQESLDRPVFLKILTQLGTAADIRTQFAQEARLLAKLNHPNIVTIYEFNADHEPPYLVLEYFPGRDLATYLAEHHQLPGDQLLSIMRQATAGCTQAHAAGILHRDIKPANVLIGPEGQVKLTDFGLAALLEASNQPVAGSAGYLAPELALGEPPTPLTDIYALGMTGYTLATGENPLVGANLNAALNLAVGTQPEDLVTLRPDLPRELVAVISRMIAKNPRDRFKDCGQALERLNDIKLEKRPSKPIQREPPAFQPRYQAKTQETAEDLLHLPSRKSWILGLISFVLLLAVIYTWRTSKRSDIINPYPAFSADSSHLNQPANSPLVVKAIADSLPEGKSASQITPRDISILENSVPAQPARVKYEPAPANANSPQGQTGMLFLAVIPWADIRVDSTGIGMTPITKPLVLSSGSHTVHFLHPDYPEISRSIQIQPGEMDSILLNWNSVLGFLAIRVYPWADIYVNSKHIDMTPLKRPIALQPGEYQLLLKNPDFPPWHRYVTVTAGDTANITVRLRKSSPH